MPQIKNIELDTTVTVSQAPVHVNGIWECGDQRFVDQDGTLYEPVIIFSPGKVSVIDFKLLFTSDERIKAKELRASKPIIDDFWSILDDPRTEHVDMSLTSIQQAISYTLNEINTAGVETDVAARTAAILSGQVT